MRVLHILAAWAVVMAWAMVGSCASGVGSGAGYCGDGVVNTDLGEECDDGNAVPGDGCSPTCIDEMGTELDCSNGIDDDLDGLIDCADPGCFSHPACVGTTETSCDDGVDNDSDGSTDCLDADCGGAPCGPNGQICSGGICACPGGASETLCIDSQDNDCDGAVDCADSDCALNPACASAETACDDSIDNDNDGSTDCLDSDCTGQPCDGMGRICSGGICACPGGSSETLCADGQDNDCDGSVDCVDPDCSASPSCITTETNCTNGVDDDNDGQIDCVDSDCNGSSCGSFGLICSGGSCICPSGTTEVCGNAIDDNCDGQIDENCTCTMPLNPSIECGAGNHCIPQPGVGSQGLCSGPTGAGSQYSYCVDNSSCGDIYECLYDGWDLLCLQWCTSYTDCPNPLGSDCYSFNTPVFVGSQEWGICYYW